MRRGAWATALVLLALLSVAPRPAWPAGFLVQEKSPRGLGSAFAGEGALAEDAATAHFNSAALTLLEGTQAVLGMHFILPRVEFENEGSTLNPAVGHGRIHGPGAESTENALVPSAYLAHEVTPRLHVGLALNAPFGLSTKYDSNWVGRYHAVTSSMRTVNLEPAVGIKVNDWLSLGAGMSALYAKVRITNAIDLGSVCTLFAPSVGASPQICPALGLTPQKVDGFTRITGDDWGFGWTLSALLKPRPGTRVGLAYRSRIALDLTGDAQFLVPKAARVLRSTGALRDTRASALATVPDTVALSAYQELTSDLAVFGDITWTHWELFRDLTVTFANPAQPTVRQPQDWTNALRQIGPWLDAHESQFYEFQTNVNASVEVPADKNERKKWLSQRRTPVPNEALRNPRVPDSDRVWASVGFGFRWNERLRLDLGYAHVFGIDTGSRNSDPVTGHVLRGTYQAGADILGVQASLRLW